MRVATQKVVLSRIALSRGTFPAYREVRERYLLADVEDRIASACELHDQRVTALRLTEGEQPIVVHANVRDESGALRQRL